MAFAKGERLRQLLELRGSRRALARVLEVVGGRINLEQLPADRLVVGLESRGLFQGVDGLRVTGSLGQL